MSEILSEGSGQTPKNCSAELWHQIEAQSDKQGLILIVDQVEEVFTRPHPDLPNELEVFLNCLAVIFNRREGRPNGKIIISYRKEYDPEIVPACKKALLPKEKIFLDRLDRT